MSAPAPASYAPAPPGGPGKKTPVLEKRRVKRHYINPIFRLLQLAALVCSFAVMLRSNAGGLRYSNFQAFSYLVAGTVIAAFWALLMLLLDLLWACWGRTVHSFSYNLLVAIGDFIALSLALTAGSAALGVAQVNEQGLPGDPFICAGRGGIYENMCARSKTAASLAIIAAPFFIPTLILYIRDAARELYEEETEVRV